MSSIVQQKDEEEEWEWKEEEDEEDGGMMEEGNNDEEGREENNIPSSTRFNNIPRPQQPLFFPIPSNINNRPSVPAHRPRRRFTFNLCAPTTILLLIPALLFVALLSQYSSTPIGGVFGLPGLLRSTQSAVEKMTGQIDGPQRPLRVMSFNIWVYFEPFYFIILNL